MSENIIAFPGTSLPESEQPRSFEEILKSALERSENPEEIVIIIDSTDGPMVITSSDHMGATDLSWVLDKAKLLLMASVEGQLTEVTDG